MTLSQSASLARQSQWPMIGDTEFQMIAERLQNATGIVLSEAKKNLAVSRLSRRLRALKLDGFEAYCDVLSGPSGAIELQEMILLLTTNVTRFFREPHHFEFLANHILPNLINRCESGDSMRIWCAGCSTGEEAYSAAMTVLHAFPEAASMDVRILATDIDSEVIATGRAGSYHLTRDDFSGHPILRKYVTSVPGATDRFTVNQQAKSLVQFARLNLQDPWPMQGKFDVIFCRNVVIYFSVATQQRLWPRFADAMNDGGHLMIGHSERVTGPATEVLRSAGVTQYELQARGARP